MTIWAKAISVLVSILVIVIAPYVAFIWLTIQEVEVTINRVEKTSNGNYVYLLEDPHDWGMIYNNDNLLLLKVNSGTLMGKLQENSRCKIVTYGIRVPLFSWAPNLLTVNGCKR